MFDEESRHSSRGWWPRAARGTVFLTTDDCQAAFAELWARGVEFTEAPQERPYGVDCGFRDPSGNSLRLTQVTEQFAQV